MQCPICSDNGERSIMAFFPGEKWDDGRKDKDIYTCQECGYEVVMGY